MDKVIIRKSKLEDLNEVMDAHRRSILELCSKDYDENQIKCWSSINYSSDIWECSVNKEFHLVLEKNNKIEGFCHACVHGNSVGEIKGLYFTKEIAGQGYGRKVIEKSLDYLKKYNCNKCIISGTKTAKPFYEKMGFNCIEDQTLNIRGADLTCYKMEMYL
ncbi:MAG: GNAT family N-acetyltransferase [Halobacteriovoraceae bacterium]|nr:GNAT family N-acetyltransferase [Halobacteriovoraceae bacterium]MCB9095356.1 GNAT family N-acetyltransferase [Halobacteriovoraceae bacterium]